MIRRIALSLALACASALAQNQAPQELIDFAKSLPAPPFGPRGITSSGMPQVFTPGTEAIYRKMVQSPGERAELEDKARRLFEIYLADAKAGDPIAAVSVSQFYSPRGVGTALDLRQGFFWAKKAAEDGVPVAAIYVGSMYEQGQGTAPDLREAARWYRKAEETYGPVRAELLRKSLVQAEALVRDKDFYGAYTVLVQAVRAEPWSAAAWYNYALVCGELAHDPQNGVGYARMAIGSMHMFLALAPDSPQARGAQDLIYQWELKAKK